MKIIIAFAILALLLFLVFALGVITGAAAATEMRNAKEEQENER